MIQENYKPIGSDTIKIYGFRFGMYRYQVEHFNHSKDKDVQHDDTDILRCKSFWDTLYGTRIYKFLDGDYNYNVSTALYMNDYIEEGDLKKMILDDVINWKHEDPYDFKDLFVGDKDNQMFNLFPRVKEHVNHNYPICEEPYDKCPICRGKLDYTVEEIEWAEDIFNGISGHTYEGEPWGEWDEIHRCPHCDKLFCVKVST